MNARDNAPRLSPLLTTSMYCTRAVAVTGTRTQSVHLGSDEVTSGAATPKHAVCLQMHRVARLLTSRALQAWPKTAQRLGRACGRLAEMPVGPGSAGRKEKRLHVQASRSGPGRTLTTHLLLFEPPLPSIKKTTRRGSFKCR